MHTWSIYIFLVYVSFIHNQRYVILILAKFPSRLLYSFFFRSAIDMIVEMKTIAEHFSRPAVHGLICPVCRHYGYGNKT